MDLSRGAIYGDVGKIIFTFKDLIPNVFSILKRFFFFLPVKT